MKSDQEKYACRDKGKVKALTEVEHTPIIVTGGSASIQYAGDMYSLPINGNVVETTELQLEKVQLFGPVHNDADHTDPKTADICRERATGDRWIIEVTCVLFGQADELFVIEGADNLVRITFNRNLFKAGANFPPVAGRSKNVRLGNLDRQLTRLQIFKDTGGGGRELLHDCPVVKAAGGVISFIVWDRD